MQPTFKNFYAIKNPLFRISMYIITYVFNFFKYFQNRGGGGGGSTPPNFSTQNSDRVATPPPYFSAPELHTRNIKVNIKDTKYKRMTTDKRTLTYNCDPDVA